MNAPQVIPFHGARLRRWRDARGLSQQQFADAFTAAGGRAVSPMTVSNWEHGKQLPRRGEIELIATVLSVENADLGPTE